MYIRFVRPTLIKGMAARGGFFTAAGALRRQPDIDPHTARQVKDLLDWFRENLAEPERFTRSASKGFYRAEFTKGLSWFKPEATEMLTKALDLVALLQDNGYPIDTLRSARIGYVLCEDAHQIVAEPFSDTLT